MTKLQNVCLIGGRCGVMDKALSRRPGSPRFKSRPFSFFLQIDQSDRVENKVKQKSGKQSMWKRRIGTEAWWKKGNDDST